MKLMKRDSTLVILLGLLGLIAVAGLASGIPAGMVIVFFVLFGVLKQVVGLKTWWHVSLGGASASILWIALGAHRWSGISLLVLPAVLAIVATVSVVKIAYLRRSVHH